MLSLGGNFGGLSEDGGVEPLLPPLLLLPLDPEDPDPATLYGSSSLEPDPKGLNCGGCAAFIKLNGPGADCARYRLIPTKK